MITFILVLSEASSISLIKMAKSFGFFKAGSPIHSTCAVSGDKAVFGTDKGVSFA